MLPTIIVLMSTFNGEEYLETQLESILAQENVDLSILVRDDGSNDSTIDILNKYQNKGLLQWYKGDNIKPAKSFMDLINKADDADYYAFSDQDDYWLPTKLYNAIKILEKSKKDKPLLYFGAQTLVDKNLKVIGNKIDKHPSVSFNTALVSSNATGCTMCFNRQLLHIIRQYKPKYQMMHDGWLHKVCLAVGGEVFYDATPYIYYRQHDKNVIGGKASFYKRWKRRLGYIVNGGSSRSNGVKELISGYRVLMTRENYELCHKIAIYDKGIINKLALLFSREIHGVDYRTDIMYRIAIMLGVF